MKKKLLLVFFVLVASVAKTQTVIITPVDDNTLYESVTGSLSNGAGDEIFVGTNSTGNAKRALLKFNIAGSVPAGATITGATLQLTMNQTSAPASVIEVHTVDVNWGEGTSVAGSGGGGGAPSSTNDATWIHTFFSTAFWSNPGGDFNPTVSASTSVAGNGNYTWSGAQMIADVQSWLDNPSTDFGWILIGDESTSPTAKRFASKEAASSTVRPRLTVTYTIPCINPTISNFSASQTSICPGASTQLTVTGSLNSATSWQLYSTTCGSTPVATNATGIFNVSPTVTTSYFVRGIGGCVTPGTCNSVTITVLPLDDPSFTYTASSFCGNDANETPVITGTTGGTFSAAPAGLDINATTGEIDFGNSTAGTYSVTYTTPGTSCIATQNDPVTVFPQYNTFTSETICNGDEYMLGTQTLTSAGSYNEMFQSVNGCDSLVNLTLSVTVVDTSVMYASFTLTANEATGTYQWVDCDNNFAPIAGETNVAFSPTNDGNYALIITYNGCTDTSNCHNVAGIGISETDGGDGITLYPNPVHSEVFITQLNAMPTALTIYNLEGRIHLTTMLTSMQTQLDLSGLARGTYFIRFTNENTTLTKKLVVE